MKAFEYVAASFDGSTQTGTAWANDEVELDGDLEARGLVLTRAKVVGDSTGGRKVALKREDLISLTNQLATVTSAGVPIVEGLEGIGRRMPRPETKKLVHELVGRLRAGENLSGVMSSYPRAFPNVYRASVEAGEASGALDTVLQRLSAHLEWVRGIRATTIQALIYPAILCVAIGGLIVILLTFVLPKIVGLFPGGTEDLPAQTKIVLGISNFLRDHALLCIVAALGATGGLVAAWRNPKGRARMDRVLMKVPRLGTVFAQLGTSKFACTASILHGAGCDVFTVLDVSASTCGNAAMTEAYSRATEKVRRGSTISDALAGEPLIDPMLVQMVDVGEKSGELDKCLDRLVRHLDEEVPRQVKRFLSLLEPALLLGAGAVVAFILLAALLPIFELYESMG